MIQDFLNRTRKEAFNAQYKSFMDMFMKSVNYLNMDFDSRRDKYQSKVKTGISSSAADKYHELSHKPEHEPLIALLLVFLNKSLELYECISETVI